MRNNLLLLLLSLFSLVTQAQTVVVPDNVYFADQRLVISEDAQKAIQKQVDALLKYPAYFQAKVDRADTYFPIVSRIFVEEGLPDDFKYLALQESGLVSDAVSTSNAVGFWQFKKEAAADHGLLITPDVDERKHIVNSSRGAAKYFVKSNTLYYKNWYNTLLSYYLGFTGAKAHAKPEHVNNKEMEVNGKTNWYILTFLAHKIAFENFIGKNPTPPVVLQEVPVTVGQSLSDIALATQTDYAEIQKYNKWLSGSVVPGNKPYTVLVPITNPNQQQVVLAANKAQVPAVIPGRSNAGPAIITKSNGLKAIVARTGDSANNLAKAGKLSLKRFRQYNDLTNQDEVKAGETYYLERKRSKAHTEYYATLPGEQTWNVAQKFGIKVKSLQWYNRLRKNENLLAGRVMWLQQRRPNHVPVEYQKTLPVEPSAQPEETPTNPLLITNSNPNPSPQNKPTVANSPASKKTVEDKLAHLFGVKSNAETKVPVKTAPVEIDENLADVNEEATYSESVATAPVIPNAPSKPETATDSTFDSALKVNEQTQVEEITQKIEVETIVDTTLANTEAVEPIIAESTPASKPEILYPTKRQPASSPTVEAPVSKSTPEVATPKENNAVVLPETTKATASNNNAYPVTVTIIQHVVSKGETLYSISRLYEIPVNHLQTWNNLTNLSLAIGQTLRLTAPDDTTEQKAATAETAPIITAAAMPRVTERATSANSATTQHIVSSGESMYQISRKYGVTIKEIMEWNKKADFSVAPGEKLTIKPKSSSQN